MLVVRPGIGIIAECLVAAIGSSVIASACILDVPLEVSCGDGWVDAQAGEECEPSLPETYAGACEGAGWPGSTAVCDPVTCLVDARPLTCAPKTCGNGVVDEGEECDPFDTGTTDLVSPRPCAGANLGTPDEIPPLVSPYHDKPYASGDTTRCTDACEWSRVGCSYCGDGIVDVDVVVDLDGLVKARPEVCDGDEIPDATLLEQAPMAVVDQCNAAGAGLRANFSCADSCRELESHLDEANCCVRGGEPCPAPGATFRCCYAHAHPEEASACQTLSIVNPATKQLELLNLCRPVGQFSGD